MVPRLQLAEWALLEPPQVLEVLATALMGLPVDLADLELPPAAAAPMDLLLLHLPELVRLTDMAAMAVLGPTATLLS